MMILKFVLLDMYYTVIKPINYAERIVYLLSTRFVEIGTLTFSL